ncbi:MAG: hypothetical protein WDN69_17800 [Aliidongia sp.]
MLDRLTASTLLRSVIVGTAAVIIVMLAIDSWNSAQRLERSNRIVGVAGVSGNIFTAMHKLRTDRAATLRGLAAEAPLTPEAAANIKSLRDAETPALRAAIDALGALDFAERAQLLPELQQSVQKLAALQTESWADMAKPKTARRDGLGKDYSETELALLATLDTLSAQLFSSIKHDDPYIDQMMELKQLAWTVRDTSGNASLAVSNALGANALSPEDYRRYAGFVGGSETGWAAFEALASGTDLPKQLTDAIATAKQVYFAPDYTALRDREMAALANGSPPEMPASKWTLFTVEHLDALVGVATASLAAARDYSLEQHRAAQRDLVLQLVLLIGAVGLSGATMMLVSRRALTPLTTLRDAMLRVSRGRSHRRSPRSRGAATK